MFVHAWDETTETWDGDAIAFTQGTVTPRRMVNGALFLLAPKNASPTGKWTAEKNTLPRGRYLVKTYVDSERRLADDPSLLLGEKEYTGQAEIKRARWRAGFRHAESIAGDALKRE